MKPQINVTRETSDLARKMESESIDWENRAAYWRIRSREALESQGVVLRPPPPPRPIFYIPSRRARPRSDLPETVVNVRQRIERVGVDLVCHCCRQHISKSERLPILCHFYAPDGCYGSPLTRCYLRCTNCPNGIVLGRNIDRADRFFVVHGGARRSPASENVPDSDSDSEDEAYPDDVMDSPNDFSEPLEHWCGATTI